LFKVLFNNRRSEELRESVDQLTRSIHEEETRKKESQEQFLSGKD
jgi:hypothetical protein